MVHVPAACVASTAVAREQSTFPASSRAGSCWIGAGLVTPILWAPITPAAIRAMAPRPARADFNFMRNFLLGLNNVAVTRNPPPQQWVEVRRGRDDGCRTTRGAPER